MGLPDTMGGERSALNNHHNRWGRSTSRFPTSLRCSGAHTRHNRCVATRHTRGEISEAAVKNRKRGDVPDALAKLPMWPSRRWFNVLDVKAHSAAAAPATYDVGSD